MLQGKGACNILKHFISIPHQATSFKDYRDIDANCRNGDDTAGQEIGAGDLREINFTSPQTEDTKSQTSYIIEMHIQFYNTLQNYVRARPTRRQNTMHIF